MEKKVLVLRNIDMYRIVSVQDTEVSYSHYNLNSKYLVETES